MSDAPQGPGWWQASDGKWYAPEQHPDYHPPTQPLPPTEPQAPVESQPSQQPPGGPPTDEQPPIAPPPGPPVAPPLAPPAVQGPAFEAPAAGAINAPYGAVPPLYPTDPGAMPPATPPPPNRTPMFIALAIAVVLLLGAGGLFIVHNNSSSSSDDFCKTVQELKDAGANGLNDPSDPNSLQTAANQIKKLADSAPSAIKPDVQQLQSFFQQLLTAKASAGSSQVAQAAAILKVIENANQTQLDQAGRNIERYVQNTCHINLDLSESVQSSLSDFGSNFGSDFGSDFGSNFGSDFQSDFGSDPFSDFSDFGSDFGSDFQSQFSSFFSDFSSQFSNAFPDSNTTGPSS
jgi:hypothetical protein